MNFIQALVVYSENGIVLIFKRKFVMTKSIASMLDINFNLTS